MSAGWLWRELASETVPSIPRPPEQEPSPVDPVSLLAFLDLTSLNGDDTIAKVKGLCRRACSLDPGPATVCVFPAFLPTAREALSGSSVRLATVAGSFPHGLGSLPTRLAEVREAGALGADEVDVVIRREWALTGEWDRLYEEISLFRDAASGLVLKVILATGELRAPILVYRASLVALAAGADFLKTSTGRETINATLEAGAAMTAALLTYANRTGRHAGLKPAGGIRTYEDAAPWCSLVRAALGPEALSPNRFRIGASALLDDLVARGDAG